MNGEGGFLANAWRPLLILVFVVGTVATAMMAQPPTEMGDLLRPPSAAHWFGTQAEGLDVLALVVSGAGQTLLIGLIGGVVAVLLGAVIGLGAGYLGGWFDGIARLLVDVALTIPSLAFVILVAAYFPIESNAALAAVIAMTAWMQPARVMRSQAISMKQQDFILMARLNGLGVWRIGALEIAPNLLPYLSARLTNSISNVMQVSIGIEVLGLGAKDTPTLGKLIYQAIQFNAIWRGIWWWWGPPILTLILIFVIFYSVNAIFDRPTDVRGSP